MIEKENSETTEDYKINEDIAKEVISFAVEEYRNPDSVFFRDKEQPEEEYVLFLKEKGADERILLNSLLLLSMMTFKVKTSTFFNRLSENSEKFETHSWIFEPEEVVKRGEDMTVACCKEYIRPYGCQKNAINGWYHNSLIINQEYDNDIRNFFLKNENQSSKIWESLYVSPRAKTKEKEFYRLGPKLSSLYLQWIRRYGLYDFEDQDTSGLPVDYQLCRIALQTRMIEINNPVIPHTLSFKILLPLFESISKDMGYSLKEISEALWLIGSEGCYKDALRKEKDPTCPVNSLCEGRLTSKNDGRKFHSIDESNTGFKRWST
jgi:hypothetical protein